MEYFLKGIKYIDLDLEKRRFRLSDSLDSYSKEDPLNLSIFIRDGNWIELKDLTKLFFYNNQNKFIELFNKTINNISYENTYQKILVKNIKCLQKKYINLNKIFEFGFYYDGNKKIIVSIRWNILIHNEKNKKSYISHFLNEKSFLLIKDNYPTIFLFFAIKKFDNIELFKNSLIKTLKLKKDFWFYRTDFSLILCIKANISKQNYLLLDNSNSSRVFFVKSFYYKSLFVQSNTILVWDKFLNFINLNEMKLLFNFNKDKKQHISMIKEIFTKYQTAKNFINSINIEPNYNELIIEENKTKFNTMLLEPKINSIFLNNMVNNSNISKEILFNTFYYKFISNNKNSKNYFYFLNFSFAKSYWNFVKNNSILYIPLLVIKNWEISKLEVMLNLLIKENIKFGIYVDNVISSKIITLLTKYEPEFCILDYTNEKFNSSDKLINYFTANKVTYKIKTNILIKG